jgi:4-diphosphocytidyl-2-C-methyl-D-erythritol kinase
VVEGDPDCPVEGNIVLRAAALLRGEVGGDRPSLAFGLRKRIPLAAGLAGGSSDAAAALDLAAAAWGLRLHPARRLGLALRLGADVPFFSAGHACALVGGIGEGLEPLPGPRAPVGLLLVTPEGRLSTADVFRALDSAPRPDGRAATAADELADALRSGLDAAGLARLARRLREANDLWPAALALLPSLRPLRDALEASLRCPVLMTGSGSTLFGLFVSPAAAVEAAVRLRSAALPGLAGCRIIVTASASSREDQP